MTINALYAILTSDNTSQQEKVANIKTILEQNLSCLNLEETDENDANYLHYAAIANEKYLLEAIYFKNSALLKKCDKQKLTPLHYACLYNAAISSEYLISCDHNLLSSTASRQSTSEGDYLAHMTAKAGHLETLIWLNKYGFIDIPNRLGIYPIHYAIQFGHASVVKYFIDNKISHEQYTDDGQINHFVHLAAQYNQLEILKSLNLYGYEINEPNGAGQFPIHIAASAGHQLIVLWLLEKGVAVDQRSSDKEGLTASYLAAQAGHLQTVRLLKQFNADFNLASNKGWLPIHIAVINGHENIINWMLENNISATLPTKEEFQPIHLAAIYGQLNCLKCLFEHHIPINWSEPEYNPFILAIAYGQDEIVKFFLDLSDTKLALLEHQIISPAKQFTNYLYSPITFLLNIFNRISMSFALWPRDRINTLFRNKYTAKGWQPIHYITEWFQEGRKINLEIIKVMSKAGMDINALTLKKESLLHLLLKQLALSFDQNTLNAPDPILILNQYLDVINELLMHRADPFLKDNDNKLAIDVVLEQITNNKHAAKAANKLLAVFKQHGIIFDINLADMKFDNIFDNSYTRASQLAKALYPLELLLEYSPDTFHKIICYRDKNGYNLLTKAYFAMNDLKEYSRDEFKSSIARLKQYGFLIGIDLNYLSVDLITGPVLTVGAKFYNHDQKAFVPINEEAKTFKPTLHHARILRRITLTDEDANLYAKIISILLVKGYIALSKYEMIELKLVFFNLLEKTSYDTALTTISYILDHFHTKNLPNYLKAEELKQLEQHYRQIYYKKNNKIASLIELAADALIASPYEYQLTSTTKHYYEESITSNAGKYPRICQNKQKIIAKLVVQKGFFAKTYEVNSENLSFGLRSFPKFKNL